MNAESINLLVSRYFDSSRISLEPVGFGCVE